MERISWDEYFMQMATLAGSRSTCLSRQVGSVIVKDKHIISTGYNGAASGVKHCSELGGCIRRAKPNYKSGAYLEICPASHSEQNAIAFAARHGISTLGATIYVNTFPCKDCMNSIINSGIKKIVFEGEYDAELSKNIVEQAGIEVVQFVVGKNKETVK